MYWLLGMVVFFLVTLTIIFRVEKRPVWPFSEVQANPEPQLNDTTGYARRWVADATGAGFSLLGWAPHVNGGLLQVMYALLVSPDRSTLAIIGAGTAGKMPIQCTWLHTPTADGRSFYTTDKQSGVTIDLSRHWTNQLAMETSFPRLWQRHQSWLQEMRAVPRNFPKGGELKQLRLAREEHFRSMADSGLVQYTDGSATKFQFTLLGACKTATWSYLLGLIRAMTKGSFPRNA
jgi:hypothetical protein